MPEYILYLTRAQFPDETPAKVRIYSSDPNRYCVGAEIKIQGVNYIVRGWDTVKPQIAWDKYRILKLPAHSY